MKDCHVLVVEDDGDVRSVIAEVLESEGFPVEQAANGHIALEKMRAGYRPDVILTNLLMPVMDGYELHAELQKDAGWSRIPLIVLTASNVARSVLDGVEAVLRKPVDLDVLLSKVRSTCTRTKRSRRR